jgi:hypothetical protein
MFVCACKQQLTAPLLLFRICQRLKILKEWNHLGECPPFLSVRERRAWCGCVFACTGSTGGSIGGPEKIWRRDEADAPYFIAPGYNVKEPAPPSVQHDFHVNTGACSGIFQTAGMSLSSCLISEAHPPPSSEHASLLLCYSTCCSHTPKPESPPCLLDFL